MNLGKALRQECGCQIWERARSWWVAGHGQRPVGADEAKKPRSYVVYRFHWELWTFRAHFCFFNFMFSKLRFPECYFPSLTHFTGSRSGPRTANFPGQQQLPKGTIKSSSGVAEQDSNGSISTGHTDTVGGLLLIGRKYLHLSDTWIDE